MKRKPEGGGRWQVKLATALRGATAGTATAGGLAFLGLLGEVWHLRGETLLWGALSLLAAGAAMSISREPSGG